MAKQLAKRSEAKLPIWERNMNPEQLECIRHDEGPCRVLAQAGSGKTRALVHRIARMVAGGVNVTRILAVTFARKAADEMGERLAALGVYDAHVSTWHSLCLHILREDRTSWADRDVDEKGKAKIALKDVVGWQGMKWNGADVTALESFIGQCNANLFAPNSDGAMTLARAKFGANAGRACEAFHLFNEKLEERNILTFDDMLVFVAQHLSIEENRLRWAARWDHVLQDEGQDANHAQCFIVSLLARDHRNYMIVGDVAQSIYGFRGSTPTYLAEFDKTWTGAKLITMNRNYRSAKAIVDVANAIIRPATVRIESDMIAERGVEGSVRLVCSESLDDEARVFADTVRTHVSAGESKYSDFTCLFRTNAQSRAVEEALLSLKIPYVVVGGTNFYERREVKSLLAYLRVASGKGDEEDIKKCINAPFRYLGARFVERVMQQAERFSAGNGMHAVHWPELIDHVAQSDGIQARQRSSAQEWGKLVLEIAATIDLGAHDLATEDQRMRARPAALLNELVSRTRYIEWLTKEEGEESIENSMGANVREMIRVAESFATVNDLLEYVDKTIKSARKQREDKQAGGERVLLMNIHRSKGLEWPHVFVCGMNEFILPHGKGDPEEERRLAYVAVTRARDSLVLSYVRRIAMKSGVKDAEPSRFLEDSGLLSKAAESTLQA